MSLNKVILIGRLGANPEITSTKEGKKIAKFNMATQNGKTAKTMWHRITVWEKTADLVEQYVKKGDEICVEGSIVYDEYTDKEGVKRYSTNIQGTNITFIGGKKDSDDSSESEAPAAPAKAAPAKATAKPAAKAAPAPSEPVAAESDDLPF